MKIVYLVPFYNRLDLTDICFSELKKQKCDIYAVGSNGLESQLLAEKYGIKYLEHKNTPVSKKNNALLSMLKGVNYDYAVLLGSDNFVSLNFTRKIRAFLKANKPDYSEFSGVYFYNQKTKKTTYYKGLTGVGRCFSKSLIEAMNYEIWVGNLNRGLDTSSGMNLQSKGFAPLVVDPREIGVEILDVKYSENITNHSVVELGEVSEVKLIDLSLFDGLNGYNKRVVNVGELSGKVKMIEIATGKEKYITLSNAQKLIQQGTYKLT